LDPSYLKKAPARKSPNRIEVSAYDAIEMKADKTRNMRFDR
jgi:hypothetical protein